MKWRDILKNISITSQRGKTKDIRLPPKEEEDELPPEEKEEEDCFEWFRQLFYLMQGDEIIEPDMDIPPFRDYTNEKLWCPLKRGIRFKRKTVLGRQSLNFESEVILPGERVTFLLWLEVPNPNEEYDMNSFYTMYFSIDSTARERIDVEFFQAALTKNPTVYDMYDLNRKIQLEQYKRTAVKVAHYMKEAMG